MDGLLKKKYEEWKDILTMRGVLSLDKYFLKNTLRVYQDRKGDYYFAIINNIERGRRETLPGLPFIMEHMLSIVSVDEEAHTIVDYKDKAILGKVIFSKSSTYGGGYISDVEVCPELMNSGLGGLEMSHAMTYLTETMGLNEVNLCASGTHVRTIKQKASKDDIINHREFLATFYSKYGFERGEVEGDLISMKYKGKGFRKPKEVEESGIKLWIPEYEK